MTGEKTRSPWMYVGVGCTVVSFALLAAVFGLGYWLLRSVSKIQVDMKDPSARETSVKAMLGCTDLPEGYKPSLALSIPFVMDMAILGDREPEFGANSRLFERRGFIYVKTVRGKRDDDSVRDFFDGKAQLNQLVPGAGVELVEGEEIGRGVVSRDDLKIRYLARRGTLKTRGESLPGITSFLFFECPGDLRFRMGIWFGPDAPAGAEPLYRGTPADEGAIRDFTSHLFPCSS